MRYLLFLLTTLCFAFPTLRAQSTLPSVSPSAIYTTADGEEMTDLSGSMDAPLRAHFYANPADIGDYMVRYEWKIWEEGNQNNVLVHRFDEEVEYTFVQSGSFCVQLYATFTLGVDTITYPQPSEENPIRISIHESKLEFPNTFTPNDDGYNDVLKAKDGYKSIVQFHAAVFNRWGTKLYEWDSPSQGWDGKYHGKVVPDGAYFLVVNAKGADGKKYNIRKTISILTGYNKEGR